MGGDRSHVLDGVPQVRRAEIPAFVAQLLLVVVGRGRIEVVVEATGQHVVVDHKIGIVKKLVLVGRVQRRDQVCVHDGSALKVLVVVHVLKAVLCIQFFLRPLRFSFPS